MAKVQYLDPIAYLSGRVSKKHSQVVYNHRSDTGANYTSMRGERTTEPKPAELAARAKFKVVHAAVNARIRNTDTLATDTLAFRKQSKYATFRGFLFAQAWALYDEQSKEVVWE